MGFFYFSIDFYNIFYIILIHKSSVYEYLIDLAVPWLPINGLAGCPSCSCPGHPLHHSGPQPPWIVLRRTHGCNHRRIRHHPSFNRNRYPGSSFTCRSDYSTRVALQNRPMGLRLMPLPNDWRTNNPFINPAPSCISERELFFI